MIIQIALGIVLAIIILRVINSLLLGIARTLTEKSQERLEIEKSNERRRKMEEAELCYIGGYPSDEEFDKDYKEGMERIRKENECWKKMTLDKRVNEAICYAYGKLNFPSIKDNVDEFIYKVAEQIKRREEKIFGKGYYSKKSFNDLVKQVNDNIHKKNKYKRTLSYDVETDTYDLDYIKVDKMAITKKKK